jgi:hypothetical protein
MVHESDGRAALHAVEENVGESLGRRSVFRGAADGKTFVHRLLEE